MAGMFMTAALIFGFVFIGMETDLWWIRGLMFGRGVAMGIAMIPMQAAMFAQISRRDSGLASALSQPNRQVAGSIACALLHTVLPIVTTAAIASMAHLITAPATARHLALKLARHFIADDPPAELVQRLAQTFTRTGGDLPSL